ncbi:hypothetical protein JOB18_006108 [Solea senegalensis]|uniref:Uncharacterized protein n=1 Tax=Solea senegalensis TaxID=28829 RepID=A0AAV6SMQ4_SOLSE|nr:hypothetical protein JOB18_006108 [Solea senegalensis]
MAEMNERVSLVLEDSSIIQERPSAVSSERTFSAKLALMPAYCEPAEEAAALSRLRYFQVKVELERRRHEKFLHLFGFSELCAGHLLRAEPLQLQQQ